MTQKMDGGRVMTDRIYRYREIKEETDGAYRLLAETDGNREMIEETDGDIEMTERIDT
jgi:hypothetical protein